MWPSEVGGLQTHSELSRSDVSASFVFVASE